MNETGTYALLCRQLASIMRANVSPLSALKICRDQMENKKLKKRNRNGGAYIMLTIIGRNMVISQSM